MVLLTSSAVSVAISSSVVCIFTFLLFLSGYVLQQQTVRSLQEAFRLPPERKPVPALPPQFRDPDNETGSLVLEPPLDTSDSMMAGIRGSSRVGKSLESVQVPVVVQDENQAHLKDDSGRTESEEMPLQRLAYIFALLEPSDLCSTLLFAKQQRSSTRLAADPSIVLLYPSTWETERSAVHTLVLSFMRDVQDLYDLIYHPVQIHSGYDVNALLLGELQWGRWEYDQALYLRSPGMILDGNALDAALSSTTRMSWVPLNPSAGDNPDVLLVTPRGLQSPRREMRKLAVPAIFGHTSMHQDEVYAEDMGKQAAYVLFDEGHLDGDRDDNAWYGDLAHKFDRGIRTVCAGSGLLDKVPRFDLKRSL